MAPGAQHLRRVTEVASAAAVCRDHKNIFDAGWERRIPTADLMGRAAQADLVFMGEYHFVGPRVAHYRELLRGLHRVDARFDCLLLEISKPTATPALSACNANPGSLDPAKFDSATEKACAALGDNLWDGPVNEAYRLGMHVHAIDVDQDCDQKSLEAGMACRDEYMAANIQELIKSGACSKVVSINGADHLQRGFKTMTYDPLGQRAFTAPDGRRLRNFRLNVMSSNYQKQDRMYDPRWRFIRGKERGPKLCDVQPKFRAENYGFLHESLPIGDLPLTWEKGPQGHLGDFDATFVTGVD